MIAVLMRRRLTTAFNVLMSMKMWEAFVRLAFALAGAGILVGLYLWFFKVIKSLDSVSIIGPLLPWKLTSMAFLITFSMVAISGLITAMTTLYYSSDLKFLFSSPIPVRTLFLDRALETAIYSSWTLSLILIPYMAAFGQVKGATTLFYVYFLLMLIPFIMLAAAFGIIMSMALMYFFPTSRTRDIVWGLCSLAFIFVYLMIRFVQPEKLVRPDTLEVVARYLQFLQAPTAPYLPSWWVSRGMLGFLHGQYDVFLGYSALLVGSVIVIYGLMVYFSKWVYLKGFSGAQDGRRFSQSVKSSSTLERKLIGKGLLERMAWTVFWKDRKMFVRDVRYWSQFALILAIVAVYLFSIQHLPVEGSALKSLIAFVNIAIAGFVVASVGLRFTFPAISMEGKGFWLLKSSPMTARDIMLEKLLLLSVPTVLLGVVLVSWSNTLLKVDSFVAIFTTLTIIIVSVVFCVMGVGLGALFVKFDIENIHQIESSAGGFIYMACCIGYLAAVLALEAYPLMTYFYQQYIRDMRWDWMWLSICAAGFIILNAAAAVIPWKMGLNNLEKYEI